MRRPRRPHKLLQHHFRDLTTYPLVMLRNLLKRQDPIAAAAAGLFCILGIWLHPSVVVLAGSNGVDEVHQGLLGVRVGHDIGTNTIPGVAICYLVDARIRQGEGRLTSSFPIVSQIYISEDK